VAVGIYLSLKYRKVTFAVIINLLLAVGIYLVAFFVLLVIGELSSNRDLAEFVGWYLPYHYLAVGITSNWSRWDLEVFSLPQNVRVDGLTFLVAAAVVGAAHLALSFAILHSTGRMFDRIVGRARQAAAPGGL
jgi:hypothetical protein